MMRECCHLLVAKLIICYWAYYKMMQLFCHTHVLRKDARVESTWLRILHSNDGRKPLALTLPCRGVANGAKDANVGTAGSSTAGSAG